MTQQGTIAPYDFTMRYPAGWSMEGDGGVWRLVNVPAERAATMDAVTLAETTVQIFVTVERRRDHAEALRRLEEIRAEFGARATVLTIGGWPAIQRRVLDRREQPGGEFEEEEERAREEQASRMPAEASVANVSLEASVAQQAPPTQQPPAPTQPPAQQPPAQPPKMPEKRRLSPAQVLRVTTAIAADNLLVRFEARLPPDAPAATEATVRAIGQSATFRTRPPAPGAIKNELARLQAAPLRRPIAPPPSRVATFTPGALGSPRVRSGAPRAAAGAGSGPSPGMRPPAGALTSAGLATRVVTGGIASEVEIAVSTNGQNIVIAQQFVYATSNDGGQTFPFTGNFPSSTNGDPSLAFGLSGTFYEATINGSSTGFNVSTDNGRTFTNRSNAYTCPTTGPNQCPAGIPDQEHIAADRFNASAGGGDQVYSAWRHLNGNYGIVCSNDGGQNWTAGVFAAGDVPRITVGQDGFVYVVYQNGNNVMLNRYSSCTAGLAVQAGFPVTVATVGPNWVQCPMPGLDRCNDGNNLSSMMVAVDDTNANHIYVTYAQNTSATNENVILRDSIDAGVTWPAARTVTLNGGGSARRFMPWVCAAGGVGYVSWFDRRAATAANNSLTDFYGGSAMLNASGTLVAGLERQINPLGTADNQCAAGQPASSAASWPGSVRAINDSEGCSQQPQLAGRCRRSPATPADSNTACDFSAGGCPAGETCMGGGGIPKYGDYNGNACAAGRFYTIWPSATTPPPAPGPAGRIDLYFASLVVASNQIQIPGPVVLPDTCVGTSSLATANICNTGTRDLHIDPITSSDPQFGVVAPSSGYPVTIAPGSCFPFQVRFTPTSPGNKFATLTVPSDDSVRPTATIQVSGRGTQTTITTMIADAGEFGSVCPTTGFRDQPLVIANAGTCPLSVTNITSSAADFQTASTVSFPFTVAPGASVAVPIRFQPTSPGPKSATLTVASSDPARPLSQVRVSGTGGQPRIVTTVVDTGSFGEVCVGATRDQAVTINNAGTCPLVINGITSSSPEFQTAQVLTFPLVVAPGASIDVPIRFAPTTPGSKTATISITSNDPAEPTKAVTLTGQTPVAELCNPPRFTSVGLSLGPTFGSSRTGDFTFTGHGRHLEPFGERHTFGLQAQGEYLYYHGRHEGQIDVGLMNRWKRVQLGVFADFKFTEVGLTKDGGVLGQASAVVDLLFNSVRIQAFGAKGFKDIAVLTRDTTITFTTPPVPGGTATTSDLEQVARVVDLLGGGAQVGVGPNTEIDGHLMWLRRARPTTLGDDVGAMARLTHHFTSRFALFGEFTFNETLLGPTDSGRVVFGFVFGRWTRPSDLTNKHTPLGTEVPRVHYDLAARQR